MKAQNEKCWTNGLSRRVNPPGPLQPSYCQKEAQTEDQDSVFV